MIRGVTRGGLRVGLRVGGGSMTRGVTRGVTRGGLRVGGGWRDSAAAATAGQRGSREQRGGKRAGLEWAWWGVKAWVGGVAYGPAGAGYCSGYEPDSVRAT
jgi:hypothetical protein